MNEQRFAALVRTAETRLRRRDVATGVAMGAVAVVMGRLGLGVEPTQAANVSAASAKKRCKRKHGVYVQAGQCRCAFKSGATEERFPCQNNASCLCLEAVDGTGFCSAGSPPLLGCATNADCASGHACIVVPKYTGSGTKCASSNDCAGTQECFKGTCQWTGCATPCL
jgi:hypothetical protein